MRRLTARTAVASLAWLTSGCVSEPGLDAVLELGIVSDDRFESYDDGASLGVVQGVQGGYHTFVDVRLDSMWTGTGVMTVRLSDPETATTIAEVHHEREVAEVDSQNLSLLQEVIVFVPSPSEIADRTLLAEGAFAADSHRWRSLPIHVRLDLAP